MTELTIRPEDIRDAIARNVESYAPGTTREEVGRVVETGDGIARVEGLHSAMTNELLEFEGGLLGLALNLDEVDLSEMAEECERRLRPDFAKAGLALRLDAPVDPVSARGDQTRLTQVLMNLLSNALKFTPEGGQVTIAVFADGGDAALSVADTGIGIKAEDFPLALSPFAQVDGGRSRLREGTGLGLPLAKSIAEAHGGSLVLESELGKGTVVTVRLPSAERRAVRLKPRAA